MTVEAGCGEESRVAAGRTRDEIILEHLPQVRLIAKRIRDRLPLTISLDDLISAGTVGLISAVDHYKASHDVKLKTYAEYKIRGAILDSLRMMDWAPRRQRKRSKLIENAITLLEQRLQRAPAEEEIAAELGLPIADYQEWLSETRGLSLTRLERSGSEENRGDVLQFVADPAESSPSELLERAELERALAQVIERLPALERTVLSLYYYEELTLREIARIVELHESRVSQLKSQGIVRLKAYVERRWGSRGE